MREFGRDGLHGVPVLHDHAVFNTPYVIKGGGRAVIDTLGLGKDKVAFGDNIVQL